LSALKNGGGNKKALEQNPGLAELHSQLGHALANRRRVAEAIAHLERAIRGLRSHVCNPKGPDPLDR